MTRAYSSVVNKPCAMSDPHTVLVNAVTLLENILYFPTISLALIVEAEECFRDIA